MLNDRIEGKWVESFGHVFELCKIRPSELVIILSETQSRDLSVTLAELALVPFKCPVSHVKVLSPPQDTPAPVRSSGASLALAGQAAALAALKAADVIIDLTVEGLMHAPELADILQSGSRVLTISNEHPDALERLTPDPDLHPRVKDAVKLCRSSAEMRVTSGAGTDLTVAMQGAATVGVWGWTDRPGTLAHWPGGIVVSFPKPKAVTGRLVLDCGDINLTFKRYIDQPITLTLEDNYVTSVDGSGVDARLMRTYFRAWADREAYATSHVGWGLNPGARYEALTMYDQRDTNGTELRALPGNFLYSTGANEFAGRFTKGHFDLPMLGCTIRLDDRVVVENGQLTDLPSLPAIG